MSVVQNPRFRLFKNGLEVRLEVLSDHRWKVVAASAPTGFKVGDEVSPIRRVSWRKAGRRVNGRRSSLSPNMLVLLRGEGFERSEEEVLRLLQSRPWDPDTPPAA